jgi:hypothetical protein
MNLRKSVVIALAAFSLYSALLFFKQTASGNVAGIGPSGVGIYEKRFEGLKKELPPRGTVGYATDVRPEEVFASPLHQAYYFLTQYALAPVVVDNNYDHELIIGNFHRPASESAAGHMHFTLLKDLGNGVVLLRNEERRR